jgi:hypothetical protein
MTPISLSRYLCVVFAVAAVAVSATSFHPAAQGIRTFMLAATVGPAVAFGVTAIVLKKSDGPEPKWLVLAFQVFAVLGTLWAILMIGG